MEAESKQLIIETITPVSVGTGGLLSPVTDFFVTEKDLYLIDSKKFQQLLKEKDKISFFTEYVSKSVNKSRTGTNADLKGFIENVLKTPVNGLIKKKLPYPNAARGKEQISVCLQSNGLPLIPGSSLKGAVKTALFYDWLCIESKETLNTIINHLVPNCDINLFTKWGYLKEVDNLFPDKKNEIEKPDLSISDTEPFSADSLTVYKTERLHMQHPERKGIPQVKMCINKEFSSAFSYRSDKWPIDETFMEQMNFFAYNAMLAEQNIIKDQSKLTEEIKNKLNAFYIDLINQIDKIDSSKERTFYVRLGSGKSYFDNSMGLAIYVKNKDAFNALCKMYQLGKSPNEREYIFREPFPMTRTVISGIYEPMGWVKIKEK